MGDDRAKYYDAAWRRAKGDPKRQIEAVLTERLHYYARIMVKNGQLESAGWSNRVVSKSGFLYHIIGSKPAAVYRRGLADLKVKRYGTPGLVVYNPDATDWDVRRNQLEARIIDLLNSGIRD